MEEQITNGIKTIRIFYKDNEVIRTLGLSGLGAFPYSEAKNLEEYPSGTKCLTLDESKIDAFLASDDNQVIDDAVVIGSPRPTLLPKPARDLAAELTAQDERIKVLEGKIIKEGN